MTPPPVARVALLSRPVGAVATLLGLALVLELTPGLARFRLFGTRPEAKHVAPPAAAPVASVGEARL